jgi:hypothetical protein
MFFLFLAFPVFLLLPSATDVRDVAFVCIYWVAACCFSALFYCARVSSCLDLPHMLRSPWLDSGPRFVYASSFVAFNVSFLNVLLFLTLPEQVPRSVGFSPKPSFLLPFFYFPLGFVCCRLFPPCDTAADSLPFKMILLLTLCIPSCFSRLSVCFFSLS